MNCACPPVLSVSFGLICVVYQNWMFSKMTFVSRLRSWRVLLRDSQCVRIDSGKVHQSKNDGKDQESIQSSTTPDPGYHMGK